MCKNVSIITVCLLAMFSAFFIITFIIVSFCKTGAAVDLCETPTVEGIEASLQQGVVPRGVVNAGNYTYDRSADSVTKCVASCCLSSTCEVHWHWHVCVRLTFERVVCCF